MPRGLTSLIVFDVLAAKLLVHPRCYGVQHTLELRRPLDATTGRQFTYLFKLITTVTRSIIHAPIDTAAQPL